MANQDISRWLLQTRKHYVAARLQQGRVLIDSDANDGGNLGAEQLRRTLSDVFGPKASSDQGFSLRQPLDGSGAEPAPLQVGDHVPSAMVSFNGEASVAVLPLALGSGSLNVGGMRFDLDQAESVFAQRDFLQLVAPSDQMPVFVPDFRQLYYLRAWEQGVSSVEDQELPDAMLKGPDSSFRIRRMRRVEVLGGLGDAITTCNDAWSELVTNRLQSANATFDERTNELRSKGMLQLVFSGGEAADACSPSDLFDKRYLGAENQTLRILQTRDDAYVWALDNGTPLFKVRVDGLGASQVTVTILNPPSDERNMPFQNRVVEIVPFSAFLEEGDLQPPPDTQFRKVADEVGVFTRVAGAYDPVAHSFVLEVSSAITQQLTDLVQLWDAAANPFAGEINPTTPPADGRFFYMRLWHTAATATDVEIAISNDPAGTPLGDTGIVPVFVQDGQPGDYWVATLRVDVPGRIQPFDFVQPLGLPPTGPRRFYAPLALVAGQAVAGSPDLTLITQIDDCRPRIRPLADRGCSTLIVGDGVHSFGDFTSIQEALDALPAEGGVVSVRPGFYQGPLTITGTNITLEGCGDATVIQSTTPSQFVSLILVREASNVRISGLKLQAVGERALQVAFNSHDVDIGSMHFVSGQVANGVFNTFGSSSFAQVEVTGNSFDVNVHDSVLDPNRQPGLRVATASQVTLSALNIVGSLALDLNDTAPLVWLDVEATDVTLSESVLDARGQQGVQVSDSAQRITLEELSIAVHRQEGSSGGGSAKTILHARPAVNVDGANNVQLTLRRSRIVVDDTHTEHAAIVVGGSSITIEENQIEALGTNGAPSHAWGGVQVRSGSQTIRIAGNQIVGGYGHGITLGSVVWISSDGFEALVAFQLQGAGAGQTQGGPGGSNVVTGTLVTIVLPSPTTNILTSYSPDSVRPPAPGVSDLIINGNRIEGMSSNGISVLTVLGLADGTLPEIDTARIERNVITGNLVNLSSRVFTNQPLPLSASTSLARIRLPNISFGGVVLATAIEVQIRDNTITSNGTTFNTLPINGIFILNGDSIDIEGNRILDNGARAPAQLSHAVLSGPRAGIAVMLAGSGNVSSLPELVDLLAPPADLDNGGVALRITNNTVRHPEGRALEGIATGPTHIQGNYLSSQGNAGGDGSSEQFQVGDLIYVLNLGGPWEGFNLVEGDPGLSNFATPDMAVEAMTSSRADSPYRYLGLGGAVLFNNNHTILDWDVQRPPTHGAPLAFFPIALLTLDHLGMLGNHMALRITVEQSAGALPSPLPGDPEVTEPVLSHVLALALTLKIELNRFSENLQSVLLSLMARADVMNSTALNQSTHDIFSIRQVRSDNFVSVVGNQVLFSRTTLPNPGTSENLRDDLQSLFGLLFKM